ncbi:MAG: hypothetical protein U1A26_01510 [Candidatus Sungbacteria bacterium]|nr:hypothetical protein [Candidatus Sungbacteria bacterium]
MPVRQKTLFLGGAGLIALGLLIFFASKFFSERLTPIVPSVTIPTPAFERGTSPEVLPTSSPAVRVVPDQADTIPRTRYDGNSFTPRVLTVGDKGSDVPCAVRVENTSRESLTVRLGPAHENEERGFLYSPVPAGQFLLIDPRYHLPLVSFYSREHPAITFEVRVEGTCR